MLSHRGEMKLFDTTLEAVMPYQFTSQGEALLAEVVQFMDDHIYPNEAEYDEQSHEFQAINPSTKIPKGLTAAEQEALDSNRGSDSSDSGSDSEAEERPVRKAAPADTRISSSSYRKAGHNNPMLQNGKGTQMVVSSSNAKKTAPKADKSFGARVSKLKERAPKRSTTTVVGEREITFAPEQKKKKPQGGEQGQRHDRRKEKNIRSASGNAFRGM